METAIKPALDRMVHPPRRTLLAAWALLLLVPAAWAQSTAYPSRPVKLVVPYAAGGNIDITARVLSQSLGEVLGQAVVVDNKAGAGGLIGAAGVARSTPDGYTLLLGSSGSITIAPAVYKNNVNFDPIKDFIAIGPIQTVPLVLVVSNKLPVSYFAELVAYSQNRTLNAGVSGIGSLAHLALEQILRQTKLKTLNVPYTSAGPAMTDLLGGQVEIMVDQLNSSLQYIRAGSLKVVAQLGSARSPLLPNVPTLAEQGLPNFSAETFTGLFAPAGIPKPVEARLSEALGAAMAKPVLRTRFKDMGADIFEMDQARFAEFVSTDLKKWKKLSQDANIVVE